jgi:thiol:disulfide interchange protein
MKILFFAIFAVLIRLLINGGAESCFAAPVKRPHVDVELYAENQTAQPGKATVVGVYFQLEEGWHVYWVNAGDSGQAPKIQWNLPVGISAEQIQWPTPRRIEVPPLMDYGYDGSVLLPVNLNVAPNYASKEISAVARVRWLVCQESCIPGEASLDLHLPMSAAPPKRSVQATFFDEARVRIPRALPSGWGIKAVPQAKGFDLRLSGNWPEFTKPPIFFPKEQEVIENAAPQKWDKATAVLHLVRSEQSQELPSELRGVIEGGGGYFDVSLPLEGVPHKDSQVKSPANSSRLKPPLSLFDWLGALISAFLGGLILNLMPCVFPVLSIKALSFLSFGGQSKSELRRSGCAYALGILCSFWVFALVMLLLRAGGKELGWGFQLQSPIFIGGLCLLLFCMGLNLLGVFEISVGSLTGVGGQLASLPGWSGSFFTGVLATLVATPCSAPFMGTALGIALGQPPAIVLTIFTSLGLGLAAPYWLLCLQPQLGKYMPRPGRWMESLRQLLSFPIFATVLWLLWIFGLQTSLDGMVYLLASLLFVSLGAWALGRWPSAKTRLAAILILLFAIWVAVQGASQIRAEGRNSEISALSWEKYSASRLNELLAAHQKVFVDFTAAWCVTCKVNEHVVLEQAAVIEKMKSQGVVLLRGDWTNGDPEITKALAQFDRNGVPLYLLYSGREGAPPVILSQILTSNEVLNELEKIR